MINPIVPVNKPPEDKTQSEKRTSSLTPRAVRNSEASYHSDLHSKKNIEEARVIKMPEGLPGISFSPGIPSVLTSEHARALSWLQRHALQPDALMNGLWKSSLNSKMYFSHDGNYYRVLPMSDMMKHFIVMGKKPLEKPEIGILVFKRNGTSFDCLTGIEHTMKEYNCSKAAANCYQAASIAAYHSPLTREDKNCIYNYTCDSYFRVNKFMRENSLPGVPHTYKKVDQAKCDTIASLQNVLKKLPVWAGTVYRGTSCKERIINALSPGDMISSQAFINCSAERETGISYMTNADEKSKKLLLTLDVTRSAHPVMRYTRNVSEMDVIVQNNTPFEIMRMIEHNDYIEIEAKETDGKRVNEGRVTFM